MTQHGTLIELARFLPPALAEDVSLGAIADAKLGRWEHERPCGVSDLRSILKHRLAHLLPLEARQITPRVVVAQMRWLASDAARPGGYSASSIDAAIDTLRALLEEAVVAGVLDKNPAARIPRELRPLPRVIADEQAAQNFCLSTRELAALVSYAEEETKRRPRRGELDFPESIIVLLAALAGARPGEGAALQWHAVDLERDDGAIAVRYTYNRKADLVRPTTKSGVARYVPIHSQLRALLVRARDAWWPATFGRKPGRFDRVAPRNLAGKPGHQIDSTVLEHLDNTSARLGIKRTTLRGLRHTFVSLLLAAGADRTLVRRMTHPSPKRDADSFETYAHEWPQRVAAVRRLVLPEVQKNESLNPGNTET